MDIDGVTNIKIVEQKPRKHWLVWLFIVIGILFTLSLCGYLALRNKPTKTQEEGVILNAPEQINTGVNLKDTTLPVGQ